MSDLSISDRCAPNLALNGTMPEEVHDVFELLRYEVAWLHAKWVNYEQLFARGQDRIATMNETAPGFFVVVSDSLTADLILGLCRLTDPEATGKNENLTLDRLAKAIPPGLAKAIPPDGEPRDFSVVVGEAVEKLRRSCSPLRDWRNKRFAHSDFPTARNLEVLPTVSLQIIERSIAAVRVIMNAIEMHYLDSEFRYEEFTNLDDGDLLIFYLNRALEYEERERNEVLKSSA